jgi:hypothetical protein
VVQDLAAPWRERSCVVGVFRLVFRLRSVDGVADHVLAVDAMAFLGAALVMMAAVCSLVAWQLL